MTNPEDYLWREAASWLTRCNLIPKDHKANEERSELTQGAQAGDETRGAGSGFSLNPASIRFINSLRDGVLLCNLLNFLDPSLDLKDFHRKPQMAQFLCSQNIKIFLDTCKTHFGLRECDLFEPSHLFDLTNFYRVLITLSRLSQCRKVQNIHPDIPGFYAQLSSAERSHSEEDIYKDLYTTNNNHRKEKSTRSTVPLSQSMSLEEEEEEEEECSLLANSESSSNDNNSNKSKMNVSHSCWTIVLNDEPIDLYSIEDNHKDEKIYEDLCYVTFTSSLPECNSTSENVICNDHEDATTKEEEVYQDLCSIQNLSRGQLVSSTSNIEQRDFVIRELIDTETNYLEVLNSLKYKFIQPLEKLLNREELLAMFPRIRELAEIHTKFLDRLHEACAPNAKTKLSQVFLDFREPFLIYGEYCSNLTLATDTLRDVCKKSPVVEQQVMQCQKEHSGGRVQLRDILSVPMQRILKYHLLLDKLVHETSPTHEDFRGLERAKEAMVDVAQFTNEVKRDSEHLVVIQKVKESILDLNLPNGNDLQQYGRLLLDGDLNIKAHEDQKTKHRYAFIFEKLMILVKTASTKIGDAQYTFREAHNLIDYRVELCHSRRSLGRDARFKYQLLLARKSQSTAFTLYMKTEAERNKWIKALEEAMDNLEPPGCRNTDHKFQITTFETPQTCRHCSKFLKGMIHQGYRCKVCEITVHKGCISSTGRCRQSVSSMPPPVCDRILSEFYWFVGTMDRDTATAKLENRKIGTYLLRVRPQGASNPNETMYALSLKTDSRVVKHMKIYQQMESDATYYFLSTRRKFKTIVELVSFYERNDLGENFAGLNQSLQYPFKMQTAAALFDFSPTEQNQLPLRKGCQIVIIGKEGDSKGWWRGKTNDRVGFFPKEYVRENPINSSFEDL